MANGPRWAQRWRGPVQATRVSRAASARQRPRVWLRLETKRRQAASAGWLFSARYPGGHAASHAMPPWRTCAAGFLDSRARPVLKHCQPILAHAEAGSRAHAQSTRPLLGTASAAPARLQPRSPPAGRSSGSPLLPPAARQPAEKLKLCQRVRICLANANRGPNLLLWAGLPTSTIRIRCSSGSRARVTAMKFRPAT